MEGPVKDLGPCIIEFNEVDLGPTFGDVLFRYAPESRPVVEDQKGVTEVDGVFVGAVCEVEVPLTRSTLANLASVIPGASVSGSGMNVENIVGESRYANAQQLVLKPVVDGVAGPNTTWLTIFKASPSVDLEITYNNEGQRVYKVIFKAYPDDTSGNVGKIWKIGT